MKTQEEIKEYLCEHGYEETIVFENPSYCEAFLGVTSDGNAVYDFDKMVQCLQEEDGMEDIDAIEFIEYNTIRALPYMGPKAPIIKYPPEDDEE